MAKGSRKSSKKCPPGQILRKGYSRKGHPRRSSKGRKGSFVSRSKVPASCVKDRGKPGKTRKQSRVLPKFSGKMHLSHFGYSTDKSASARQASLIAASKEFQPLEVLRHLNLARNYQADDPQGRATAKIMADDVKFMSEYYQQWKHDHGVHSQSRSRSRKSSKKGSRAGSKKKSRSGSKRSRKQSRSRKGSKKSSRKSKKHSRKH